MSKVLDIQTVLELIEKEIETLKQSTKNIIIMHHEELDILHKEIDELKEENKILTSKIREYNTPDSNDMANMNSYEKWLDGEGGKALADAYANIGYNAYNEDGDESEIEYEGLEIVK